MTSLMDSMKFSMPKVILAQHISEPAIPKQQSVTASYLLDHQANEICPLKGHKEG